jgi:hypothetical protein
MTDTTAGAVAGTVPGGGPTRGTAGPTLVVGPGNTEPSDPLAGPDVDVLRREYDRCLDALAEIRCEEARVAARKARTVGQCAELARAMAPPGMSLQEQSMQEMSLVAELAGVLTVSEAVAGNLLVEARELTGVLPLTLAALAALEAGSVSWQHARIMVDEAGGLGPVGAGALEAHFLGPEASASGRGALAGELVPGRFRARARGWRERHHPVSIEKRHAKGVAERRVLFVPDRDGMAWLSAAGGTTGACQVVCVSEVESHRFR